MGPHGVAPSCMVNPCLMKADAASHPSHPRRPITDKEASLRVEVESPFRSLRIIVLGFCIASAGIGSLFSLVYILKDGVR